MKSETKTQLYSGIIAELSETYTNEINTIESYQTDPEQEIPDKSALRILSCCLIDHSGRYFACIHEECKAHKNCIKNEVLEGNSDFHSLNFHPDDKSLLYENIFPDILKFIELIPANELPEYRFSFNHRYIHKDGSISQFKQEGTLSIDDEKCLPVLNMKVFTEIGDIKTDTTIILSIYRYSAEHGYQKIRTKVYGANLNTQLTLRETEIINLCLEGLTSKMIAKKLNISIHTVKNHKRNCMEKTLTHNIAELIHLCILNHWI